MNDNPMHNAHVAPRCGAKSKRTGQPCRAPAVRGWKVCRMHGARGGAPKGEANGTTSTAFKPKKQKRRDVFYQNFYGGLGR